MFRIFALKGIACCILIIEGERVIRFLKYDCRKREANILDGLLNSISNPIPRVTADKRDKSDIDSRENLRLFN